jgi:Ni/Co efflux regulator RcnB
MHHFRLASATLAVLALGTSLALAQPRPEERHDEQHQDQRRDPHPEWRKGGHMRQEDWRRGDRVDYREHHLRPPPRGYEWREVDGRFILGAIATGVIADIILNAR